MSEPPTATGGEQRAISRLLTLRGMRSWILSSALTSVYTAITTGAYSTGYALFLGASNAQIGFLSAAPAWGQVLQIFSPLLIERLKRRKALCVAAYAVSYSVWLPVALIPFVFASGFRPWAMILLVAVSGAALALAAPASSSWLTDLVPTEARARFVSRQQIAIAAVGLAASLIAGRYIDVFSGARQQTGFMSLFIFGVIAALAAVAVWSRVPEPLPRQAQGGPVLQLLALPVHNTNFRNLTVFIGLRTLSVMIAAPFFTVYMLRHLEISYAQIALFSALNTISLIAANPLWAYLADKFGYRPVLQISGVALALVPAIWFCTTKGNYLFVTPMAMLWSGVMAAGVILSQFNLVLKTAPEDNRSVYLGFHSAMVSICLALGSMLGGALGDLFVRFGQVDFLGLQLSNLHFVFLVSSTLRFSSMLLLRRVREEESVPTRVLIDQVRSGKTLMTFWTLLRMAHSQDAAAKAEAARALGVSRSKLAVEELIPLLDDTDREVRREAARALGEIGDHRAVGPLIEKCRDVSADIVHDAIDALGRIRSGESQAFLLKLLDDERYWVRKAAALGLGNIGGRDSVTALQQLLDREHDQSVFLAAVEALSKIGGNRALHQLRVLLRKARPGVARRELANCIGSLLGRPGAFYRLLQAEPMQQEELVARAFASGRRVLCRRWARRGPDREYVERRLSEGLQAFSEGDYAGAILSLHRTASRALRSAVGSPRLEPLLTSRYEGEVAKLPADKKVSLLVQSSERLRMSYGFLSGLRHDAQHDAPSLEEALLAVFAFRQIVEELMRVGR